MEPEKHETMLEKLTRFKAATSSMTQEQVDACAWLMGAYSCGWTPETLAAEYQKYIVIYHTKA